MRVRHNKWWATSVYLARAAPAPSEKVSLHVASFGQANLNKISTRVPEVHGINSSMRMLVILCVNVLYNFATQHSTAWRDIPSNITHRYACSVHFSATLHSIRQYGMEWRFQHTSIRLVSILAQAQAGRCVLADQKISAASSATACVVLCLAGRLRQKAVFCGVQWLVNYILASNANIYSNTRIEL